MDETTCLGSQVAHLTLRPDRAAGNKSHVFLCAARRASCDNA